MIVFLSTNKKSKISKRIVKLNNFQKYKRSNLGNDHIPFN